MSSTSSSDSDAGYSNFQKYKKKNGVKKRKAIPPKTSPKKFESRFTNLLEDQKEEMNISDGSGSDPEILLEQMKKESKNKPPVELEILDDDLLIGEIEVQDEPGPSGRTRSRSKPNKKIPFRPNRAAAILAEAQRAEIEQREEVESTRQAIKYLSNNVEVLIDDENDKTVTISLKIINEADFHEVFKYPYTQRFDNVFLDYGSKAGYDRPEDILLLWETADEFKMVKYFDTPEKLQMPIREKVTMFFKPKEGVKRDKREEGEMKIKLNMKSEKVPLERLIHKDMSFGVFKAKLCKELNITLGKLRFNFDGDRIADDETPTTLDMEEYDIIDVIVTE